MEKEIGLSQFKKHFKNAIIVIDNNILKISKKENTNCFFEIYQKGEDSFGIDLVMGTIENPSKIGNARWYKYGDKYYSMKDVIDFANNRGIK